MSLISLISEDKKTRLKKLAAKRLFNKYINKFEANLKKDPDLAYQFLEKAEKFYGQRLTKDRNAAKTLFLTYIQQIEYNLDRDLELALKYWHKAKSFYEKRLKGNLELQMQLYNSTIEYSRKKDQNEQVA